MPPSLLMIAQTGNTPYRLRGANALALALRGNDSLHSLSLAGCGFGAAAVDVLARALSDNRALRHVLFDASDPLDVHELNGANSAATVDLGGKGIGMASLAFVAYFLGTVNDVATALVLADNATKADGADAVARMIVRNKKLTALDLSDNRLGEDGAVAVAAALKKNRTICRINMTGNSVRCPLPAHAPVLPRNVC